MSHMRLIDINIDKHHAMIAMALPCEVHEDGTEHACVKTTTGILVVSNTMYVWHSALSS